MLREQRTARACAERTEAERHEASKVLQRAYRSKRDRARACTERDEAKRHEAKRHEASRVLQRAYRAKRERETDLSRRHAAAAVIQDAFRRRGRYVTPDPDEGAADFSSHFLVRAREAVLHAQVLRVEEDVAASDTVDVKKGRRARTTSGRSAVKGSRASARGAVLGRRRVSFADGASSGAFWV